MNTFNEVFYQDYEEFTYEAFVLCAMLIREGRFSPELTSSLLEMAIDAWQLVDDAESFFSINGGLELLKSQFSGEIENGYKHAVIGALESSIFCEGNCE